MTPDVVAQEHKAALDLTGKIAANPALAAPILQLLEQTGDNPEKLRALSLGALTAVKDALPSAALSPEAQLRKENRIQDNAAILAKLGYSGEIPQIPARLVEECARTNGTVVLRFKTTVTDLQSNLNEALGADKKNLHLYVDGAAKTLATTNDKPEWINVPNTVRDDTLGLSKTSAKAQVKGETCDPMDTVLMLSYNNLQTGQQMPGFKNKWTFTDRKNTLVGSDGRGINVVVYGNYGDRGNPDVGLAPRFAPESKN